MGQRGLARVGAADIAAMSAVAEVGRPRSLSEPDLQRVLQLRQSGLGYRAISRRLLEAGVWASRGEVRRALKGEPPYHDFSSN